MNHNVFLQHYKDIDKWKVRKITRTVVYRSILESPQWFGEIELIQNKRRITRVYAYEDAFILYLTKNRFLESKGDF